jgi:hypothetical protein
MRCCRRLDGWLSCCLLSFIESLHVFQVEGVLSDARCPQYMRTQITPGKGINRRGCILMTHSSWLRKEKAARAQLMADPKEPKQIFGKNFDISNCKCPCKSKDINYHSRDSKHNAYVKAFEQRLREGEALNARDDDAIKLAQAYILAHPVVRVEGFLGAVDDGVDDFAGVEQMIVAADADADGDLEEGVEEEVEEEEEEEGDDFFDEDDFMK